MAAVNQNAGNLSLNAFLERSYGKKLSEVELADYKNRLIKFFSLLIEIDQKKRKKEVKNGRS